ncbi:S41 family peptidase [Sphingobacterium bovistauri]|uniref:Peptidase S41 n=1 Tax=Sphingobacterium bovistauri TaxID=2781959 RepID=A0ABS7Z9W4_9SPHI|nr:S41 family peptidase [Sphingobacterium bovistauri]MCA5006191.1 peptidase S41 [Sphingobacterium bovistauri]
MKVNTYILGLILTISLLSFSCKKDDYNFNTRFAIDTTKVYTDDAYENRIKDSVWYYYKYLTLWEPVISPAFADIEKMEEENYLKNNYTKYFQTASDVLGYLMYMTKASVNGKLVKGNNGSGNNFFFYSDILYTHNKGESKAYDWYSFLDRGGFITGSIQQGYHSGFGMDLVYIQSGSTDKNPKLYVRFVEKNSAAYQAGLRRGAQITSLNGDKKIDYETQKAGYFNSLNNYLNSRNLTVEYRNTEGESRTVNIDYRYNNYADAIFVDTVLTAGNKKIGYLGLSSFLSTDAWVQDKGQTKSFQSRMNEAFEGIANKNVQEMVVDLRYNGGGSVTTAEYLGDILAPMSSSGNLKFKYKINNILKELEWDQEGDEFGPTYFSKKGNLNLSRIYFLVSEETASASELLINLLAPHMKVYVIGTYKYNNGATIASNTYGKPVGFFPVEIVSSSNELYVTSFQMFNKDGFGDYFDGLKPNSHVWELDSFKDFGNMDESMLSAAIYHINNGVFSNTKNRAVTGSTNFERKISKDGLKQRKIQGMYKFPNKRIHF